MSSKKSTLFLLLAFAISQVVAQDLSKKANDFLNTLSPELKSEALFSLDDAERINMNYVPIERKGPTFHDFNKVQKKAALDLLRASVSEEGYRKSNDIMSLEAVLFIIENQQKNPDGSLRRDPLNYHFCIFGQPSPNSIWGWRFEGHHISLNFTAANGKIVSSTPFFFGTNPAVMNIPVQRGKEVLRLEAELGFKLVNSLSKDQLKTARFSDKAPKEIITGNKHKIESFKPIGIPYTSMTSDQRKVLIKLLNVYIDNYELGFSKTLKDKINKAGVENLYFAWAGSLSPGTAHYYRIHGPMLIIEYDNIQNQANHVHSVVRDLTNDFAEDLLKAHYQKDHQ